MGEEWGWIRWRSGGWRVLLGHILLERISGQLHGDVTQGDGTVKVWNLGRKRLL